MPAISRPAISCPAILMVRHFHVQHFQSTHDDDDDDDDDDDPKLTSITAYITRVMYAVLQNTCYVCCASIAILSGTDYGLQIRQKHSQGPSEQKPI